MTFVLCKQALTSDFIRGFYHYEIACEPLIMVKMESLSFLSLQLGGQDGKIPVD
jgi:hypothetical protein